MTEDPVWFDWSAEQLTKAAESFSLMINPIVYSEVSAGFSTIEGLEKSLPADSFMRHPPPWEAAFQAGKCFLAYRRSGGERRSPLPDFYIGAHAAVAGLTLLTRDVSRDRTYFPTIKLIAPQVFRVDVLCHEIDALFSPWC